MLALVLSDVVLALLVWGMSYALRSLWGTVELSPVTAASLGPHVVTWVGMRAVLGLYPGYGMDQVEELRRQSYGVAAALAVTAVFALATQVGESLSRMMILLNFVGLLLLAPLMRSLAKRALQRVGLWGKPVMVLGSYGAGERLQGTLHTKWHLGLKPVQVFDAHGDPKARTLEETVSLALGRGVDTAIFATPHTRREDLARLVSYSSTRFRCVIVMPNLDGITNSAVTARDLAGSLGVEIRYNLLDPWSLRAKRILDLFATALGAVFVLPLLVALTALVYLDAGRPIFYSDLRLGSGGRRFRCLKFRTMLPDSENLLQELLASDEKLREEYSKYHKLRDDPRVTRSGRFLRKTSLDELPQLWNVLRGEMSLVGPRPYLPRESGSIGATQGEILRVPAGITGPWQVSGRNESSFEERVRMDAYYVRDWSVWLDVVILARTVRIVVLGRGAC